MRLLVSPVCLYRSLLVHGSSPQIKYGLYKGCYLVVVALLHRLLFFISSPDAVTRFPSALTVQQAHCQLFDPVCGHVVEVFISLSGLSRLWLWGPICMCVLS